jgi:hemerythrin-like metal-binding protein
MPLIQWTQDLSVSVEALDSDHKVLIDMINQLDDAIKGGKPQDTVSKVLNALLDYTGYHFEREEALMDACGYPDLDAHARTHKTLKAQVANIRDRYDRNPESIHEREVLAFLKNWLTAHILGRDQLYSPFMTTKHEKVESAAQAFSQSRSKPSADASTRS